MASAILADLQDAEAKVWISYNAPAYLRGRHSVPQALVPTLAVVEALAVKPGEQEPSSTRLRRSWYSTRPWSAPFTVVLVGAATALAACSPKGPFLAESHTAMVKMMAAMDVKSSGDADADFVAMMIPHHQGAIDVARAELRYGRNEQLRRMAQEIIVTQQEEITAMHLAIGEPLRPSAAPPVRPSSTYTPPRSPHSMRTNKEP